MPVKEQIDVPFEIKEVDEKTGEFEGYGSTFGGKPDSYGDIILPGAFAKSISKGGRNGTGVALLWQHKSDAPVGVWVEMAEDKKGLKMKGKLTLGVRQADEALLLMRDKAIRGLSIGFQVPKGGAEYDRDKGIRYLKEVLLWEVSLVTFPANTRAQLTRVKSLAEAKTPRELELCLREAGLSRAEAKLMVKRCKADLDKQMHNHSLKDIALALRVQNIRDQIRAAY